MSHSFFDRSDPPEQQIKKLLTITDALMRRVEETADDRGMAYAQFQRAVTLEEQVKARTRDLAHALDLLNLSNARLEEANRAAESARQNLADAIETIEEGFALFDPADRLVMFNSRFSMHLADVHGDLRPGLAFADYVALASRSEFLSLPHEETREEWAIARLHRHAQPHCVFNVSISGDTWLQVSERRTHDGGTVIIQTDITETLRLERQERDKMLDEQARLVRATLDHINQGLCIFDASARIAGFNERLVGLLALPRGRLRTGLSVEAILTRIAEISWSGRADAVGQLRRWMASGHSRGPLRFEFRCLDGTVLDLFAGMMPNRGFVMSFTDVTAERNAINALSRANETLEARVRERTLELEDALAKVERASATRSRFVAAASHDILQPLSAAKLFISSMDAGSLEDSQRFAVQKAHNALSSVEAILAALLDISRLESGAVAVSPAPVALEPLLQQLKDEFLPLAVEKNLELIVVPSSAVVISDPAYLRRILQNLVSNAIRYTRKGRVLLGVRRGLDMVRIEVWDTGPGIPEAEQENIFKEFHRLEPFTAQGLGLGLAIVERACAVLDHPLTLYSEMGKGTRFMLIAQCSSQPKLEPAPEPAEISEEGGDSRLIFVVERDENLRQAMTLLLESWGHMTLDAEDGQAALALLDELGIVPDAFVIDDRKGHGLRGTEFAAQLRARHGYMPIAMVSADRSEELSLRCLASDVTLMRKPLSSEALEAFLSRVNFCPWPAN